MPAHDSLSPGHMSRPSGKDTETSHPDTLEQRVLDVLENLRPSLRADGGDIELLGVDGDTGLVRVRLTGACRSCSASLVTLTMGVEAQLLRDVPEVREVIAE